VLHNTKDINKLKTESAIQKLNALNPDCQIEVVNERLTPKNSLEILKGSDFVIEGSDNLQTKMLANDTCVKLKIPISIAGVLRFHGQLMTVVPKEKTACYKCIFPVINGTYTGMSCSEVGVIGFIPGILGCLQANEAIKHILSIGDLIVNKMLFVDILHNNFSIIDLKRDNECDVCGENPKEFDEIINYWSEDFCR
jgi:adenylyltransferase/sulfurtransferase